MKTIYKIVEIYSHDGWHDDYDKETVGYFPRGFCPSASGEKGFVSGDFSNLKGKHLAYFFGVKVKKVFTFKGLFIK